MAWDRDANYFPAHFIPNAHPPGTSFWDQFTTEAKDSAETKWLRELARASDRLSTHDGWV